MIVEALGLEASASTWLYNIVRAIVRTKYPRSYSVESTNLAPIQRIIEVDGRFLHQFPIPEMDDPDAIIIKGHNCDSELYWFLRAARALFVLSLRDPRDAMASMITRLGENEQAWAEDLTRSLAAIYTARNSVSNLLFSYEDRFFENHDTLDEIAQFLKIDLSQDQKRKIFESFTRHNVEKFLNKIDSLPDERKIVDHAGRLADRETMFNRSHIGDSRSGKWQSILRPELHRAINRCFDGIAGKRDLEAGVAIRFPEALFAPERLTDLKPYNPQRERLKILLLRMCFLPRGVWRITIRGDLPPTGQLELEVLQAGAPVFSRMIEGPEIEDMNVVFELEHRKHAEPFSVRISGYDIGLLNPLRTTMVEMEAIFVRSL